MSNVEGFILVGGASSRMGTNKARLRLEGQTFVERIADALAVMTQRISVVGGRGERAEWGLPAVPDIYHGRSALVGLHAGLFACRAPWAAVVSCDLPFVTGELLMYLASLRNEIYDAVAPMQADGRPQPLCALYARERCLETVEHLLESDEHRPRVLLQRVRTRWVTSDELANLDDAPQFFMNINTPEDYALAKSLTGDR